MPRMVPGLQRLPKALLVSLVGLLVFGGLLGTVSATDGRAHGVPDRLVIPAPAVGDRWTYQAVLEGAWSIGSNDSADGVRLGTPFPYAEFEWLDPAVVRDAGGREVAVDRLAAAVLGYSGGDDGWWSDWWGSGWGDWFSTSDYSDEDAWIPQRDVLLLRMGTAQAVARESATESYGSDRQQANFTTAGSVPVAFWDVETVAGWGRTFGDADVPCLARWDRQGGSLPTDEALVVPGSCLPGLGQGQLRYEAAALETVAGRQAVRFDGPGGALWLAADLPVPLQWQGSDGGRLATVTLTSWTPGTQALGTPRADGLDLAPPVELAPRQMWGPDDRGVDHPYPASAAFRAAREDPAWPDLRDWLADHPGAFTFLLEYNEDLSALPHERQWLFVLTDGMETWGFVATQLSFPGAPVPLATRHEEAGWTSQYLDILAPDPEVVPDLLPTVASVLARWEAFEATEGRSEPANGWGMAIHCPVGCFDLQAFVGTGNPWTGIPDLGWLDSLLMPKQGYAEVVAGRHPIALMRVEDAGSVTPAAPGLPGERTFAGSQLTVRDGATTRLIEWTGYASSGASVGPLSTQDPLPASGSGAGNEDAGIGRALAAFLPTPEQGAAITVASAVAGLLYWLWPTLKSGAAGLFSRVSGPRLLDHPARARLHTLVEAEPGIHFQDLVRKSGLANGTAVHHLHKLAQSGLVAARPLGRYTCYFPGSSPTAASLAAAPVTRADGARRILAELAANPGLSGLEVATRLGLQPSTVAYHVKRLQEAGLVAAQRDGRAVRLRATGPGPLRGAAAAQA